MASVITYSKAGLKSASTTKLDVQIFGITDINHELLKQAYITQQANERENLAKTKKRGEVSGGGKKPWKQKGTGRARFGSSRVPIWRGGGIVFGPSGNENYSKKMNVKAKQSAIRQALSTAVTANKVCIIDTFEVKDGKTTTAHSLLKKIGAQRRTLIVVPEKTEAVESAIRNLPEVKLTLANYLNVVDILNADSIIVDSGSLQLITDWLKFDQKKGVK